MKYYLEAASKGMSEAQFSVGLMYETGKGVQVLFLAPSPSPSLSPFPSHFYIYLFIFVLG